VTPGDVRVAIPAGSPAAPVAVPLVLGLAARAGLPVERVDEVALAVEMLLGERAAADLHIALRIDGGVITVEIEGVPADRVERQQKLLLELIDRLDTDGVRVEVSAGG
jgi:hypothetical protein